MKETTSIYENAFLHQFHYFHPIYGVLRVSGGLSRRFTLPQAEGVHGEKEPPLRRFDCGAQ